MRASIAVALVGLLAAGTARADIDNLRFLGHNQVNPNHLMDVEVVGDRAFVCVGASQGLETYDISDPANPVRLSLRAPACWRASAFGDTWLAAFCRRAGVVLYDIAGGEPSRLGQYDPPGNREALEGGALVGETLYCAAHQNGIHAIDVSDPARMAKVGAIALDSSSAWNVVARDSFLLVANGRFGLAVVGLAGGMHLAGRLALPGLANDVAVVGDVAVVALGVDGLATVDVSDPRQPTLLDTIGTAGCVWGIGLAHPLVIAGSWRVMELFDVSNPSAIERVGWDNTYAFAHGADIRSDSLIAVADWRGMSCYRVGADPGPDIDLEPPVLDFGSVTSERETSVVVRNTGAGALDVSGVTGPAGFLVEPSSFSVPAGESAVVSVRASGTGSVRNVLTYASNDPDEPSRTQEVYKNNSGFPQVGSIAPDFTLRGTDAGWHTLSANRGKVVYLEFGASW